MKKSGFTLAEVLITLGIIGVVAALTTPALNSAYQQSKVPPTLRKFINTMETANQHILNDNESTRITVAVNNDMENYYTELSKYVEGVISDDDYVAISANLKKYNGDSIGAIIAPQQDAKAIFSFADGSEMAMEAFIDYGTPKGSYKGGIAYVLYDINGFNTKPGRVGKDIFEFSLDDGGAVIPWGGKQQRQAYDFTADWKDGNDKCSEDTVNSGETCAGSIADNNWKIIYKY